MPGSTPRPPGSRRWPDSSLLMAAALRLASKDIFLDLGDALRSWCLPYLPPRPGPVNHAVPPGSLDSRERGRGAHDASASASTGLPAPLRSCQSSAATSRMFAALGVAVVDSSYRQGADHPHPAALDDLADVTGHARAVLWPNLPIGVAGGSSGGYLARDFWPVDAPPQSPAYPTPPSRHRPRTSKLAESQVPEGTGREGGGGALLSPAVNRPGAAHATMTLFNLML